MNASTLILNPGRTSNTFVTPALQKSADGKGEANCKKSRESEEDRLFEARLQWFLGISRAA